MQELIIKISANAKGVHIVNAPDKFQCLNELFYIFTTSEDALVFYIIFTNA